MMGKSFTICHVKTGQHTHLTLGHVKASHCATHGLAEQKGKRPF